jgi:hypothetical protein
VPPSLAEQVTIVVPMPKSDPDALNEITLTIRSHLGYSERCPNRMVFETV